MKAGPLFSEFKNGWRIDVEGIGVVDVDTGSQLEILFQVSVLAIDIKLCINSEDHLMLLKLAINDHIEVVSPLVHTRGSSLTCCDAEEQDTERFDLHLLNFFYL